MLSRYFGIYSMIYFVFRKANKPLKNRQAWFDYGLKPVFVVSFLFNIGFIIYLEIKFHIANDTSRPEIETAAAL